MTDVEIPIEAGVVLHGTMTVPDDASGFVVFAHGSGSSRLSPRNRAVAAVLNEAGIATLLPDLLTAEEEEAERVTRHLRFDVGLLAGRLLAIVTRAVSLAPLPLGLFGASTGAAAALVAAARRPDDVRAVVSRGGRPDLAGDALAAVRAPTLLIVGSRDEPVIDLNERARALMRGPAELRIVEGATHLFEEPDALEEVARLARDWFERHLGSAP